MIRVSEPYQTGREREYVIQALDANALSIGGHVIRFERAIERATGAQHAATTSSGTAALHLIMLALGVAPGQEVIVPTLTYVATANAVAYCGARPVFADVDENWNIDPEDARRLVSKRTVGIIAVHLYGHPANMPALRALADEYGLWLVEDAAEAIGAKVGRARVGSLGDAAAFSFYGNKAVTSGEGGAVTTNNPSLDEVVRVYRGQGQGNTRYWHEVIGHNYRMANLLAAVGLAQIEGLNFQLESRALVAEAYREQLSDVVEFQPRAAWASPVDWLTVVLLPKGVRPDDVGARMLRREIETRPVFYPLHHLPPYRRARALPLKRAEEISARGLCLPTHGNLERAEVLVVCDAFREALRSAAR